MRGARSPSRLAALLVGVAIVGGSGVGATQAAARRPSWLPASDAAAAERTRAAVVAVAARTSELGGITRLVFDLSGPVSIAAAFTERPDRLILDLPEVNFQLDAPPTRAGTAGVGLIRDYRCGLVAPGRSRIVIDLTGPAVLRKAEVTSIAGGAPSRLTIELDRTERAAFHASARDGGPGDDVRDRAAPVEPAASRPVVVLDPGHGGVDPGAGGPTGTMEKDVVLAFAGALAEKLSASGRYRVVLTRRDDSFVSLGDRVRVARDAEAGLLISIHADMLSDASVTGATVYTASDQASDAEAARVAAAENKADETAGLPSMPGAPDVSDILFDLARRETRTYAHQFQRNLTGYWSKIARLNRNPERAAGFKVLQAPDVPSVLLELGYLSNEKDRTALTSPAWRGEAAASVASAVDSFFAARSARPEAAATTPGAAAQR